MNQNITVAEDNLSLERNLAVLKSAGEFSTVKSAAEAINTILYQAIVQYPMAVNAVQLRTQISLSRDDSRLPEHNSIFSGRYKLENFLHAILGVGVPIPDPLEFTFTKLLPYAFTTGTHGSGERQATGASYATIDVEVAVLKKEEPCFFRIDCADGGMLFHENAHLFCDEVLSLQLVQCAPEELTYLARRLPERREAYTLEEAESPVAHYLGFRGFSRYSIAEENVPKSLRGEVAILARKIAVPEMSTGLFERHLGVLGGEKSFSGFAADLSEGEPILYEFNDISIARPLREGYIFGIPALTAAAAIVKHRKSPSPRIQTYKGQEIIVRLAAREVRRNF